MDIKVVFSNSAVCQKLLDETESAREALQDEAAEATERAEDRCAQAKTLQLRESELLSSVSSLTSSNMELNVKVKELEEQLENFQNLDTEFSQNKIEFENLKTKHRTLGWAYIFYFSL